MPCTNGPDDYREELHRDIENLRKHAAKLSGWLCDMCQIIDEINTDTFIGDLEIPAEIQEWYHAHTVAEEDKIRAEAAKKLTKRERKALGIDENGLTSLNKSNKSERKNHRRKARANNRPSQG